MSIFVPLTGPAAGLGDHFRKAALLSYDKLPLDVRGRLHLTFEDTQMKSQSAVSAFKNVLVRRRPDVLAVAFAESTIAIAPLAQQEKIALVACAPTRGFLKDRTFTFRHWVDAESMSPVLAAEMIRLGMRRIAIVHSEHAAMVEFAEYFGSFFGAKGVEVADKFSVLPDDTDFRSIAVQLAQKKVDGIVYFLLPPQPSMFTKQLRSVLPNTRLFAFINTESSNEVKSAFGAMEGVIYAGPVFTPAFLAEYADRYDGDYPEICSGNFYDIVQMVGDAVSRGRCTSDELREHFGTMKTFRGAGGEYGVSEEREFRLPIELRTVKDGKFAKYP